MGNLISSDCHNIGKKTKNNKDNTNEGRISTNEETRANYEEKIASYENPIQILDNNKIQEIVKQLLKNKNINVGLLPDAIEGKLYENMIKIVLAILQDTLQDTKIDLLGHQIKMSLIPQSNN